MTRPVKVMVADDAVVIRRLLSDVLDEDPGVEVVGVAANGRLALQKLEQLDPDVVILDIEMPVLDGLGTLRELRKLRPKLPVIMFSTLTERGATATFEALTLGASDYVTKPSNTGSVHESMQRVREELIPKIKALAARAGTAPDSATRRSTLGRAMGVDPDPRPGAGSGAGSGAGLASSRPAGAPSPAASPSAVARTSSMSPLSGAPAAGAVPTRPTTANSRIDAVVIGVSTGGPVALGAVIPALPADLPVPVLVVQHMPALFTRILAERIDAQARLQVVEAEAGEPVIAGRVYIAPGDRHMLVQGRDPVVVLDDGPPVNSCRPAVDQLFASAATCFGPHVLAVVLTGMGHDGAQGCGAIRRAGGHVIVQDEATSVVWGMPGAVVRDGFAQEVVGLDDVASTIQRIVERSGAPRTAHHRIDARGISGTMIGGTVR